MKNATATDYQNAYADLERIGLHKTVVGDSNQKVIAPTTMTMGTFNGASVAAVRYYVRDRVRAAFNARGFRSEIFVVAAGDWAWGATTTP